MECSILSCSFWRFNRFIGRPNQEKNSQDTHRITVVRPRLAPPPVEIQQRAYKWNDNDERFRNLSSASWEPFPAKQLEAGAVLLAKLHREHGLAANALAGHQTLFGHSELAPWKADPGPAFPFGRFTADVLRRISRPANVA